MKSAIQLIDRILRITTYELREGNNDFLERQLRFEM